MKRFIIRLLQLLVSNKSVFLKAKDTVFCNPAEHLYRLTAYAQKKYNNKLHLPIIDVGAANGDTAAYFSENFKQSTVIAFEPITKMFDIAKKRNAGNLKVEIRNLALFDTIGKNEINITANYLSSSVNELNVSEINSQPSEQQKKFEVIERQIISTSTLDEETKTLNEILLIKLDTQGSELKILKHGIQALKKTNMLLIEMSNHNLYKDGCQYYEVDEFLRKNGFQLIDIIVVYRPEGLAMEYDAIYGRT